MTARLVFGYSLLFIMAGLAVACDTNRHPGQRGELVFEYHSDKDISNFNKPIIEGGYLDLFAYDVGDRQPAEVVEATSLDPDTLRIEGMVALHARVVRRRVVEPRRGVAVEPRGSGVCRRAAGVAAGLGGVAEAGEVGGVMRVENPVCLSQSCRGAPGDNTTQEQTMSWTQCPDPIPGERETVDAIETLIVPRAVDLGGLEVRRVLPARQGQMVGPFIFFDQMGPAEFLTNDGIDVRPHPHINLATVTYLFEGEIIHRDSLGTEQAIKPGAINWMRAGSGIVHSERTGVEER